MHHTLVMMLRFAIHRSPVLISAGSMGADGAFSSIPFVQQREGDREHHRHGDQSDDPERDVLAEPPRHDQQQRQVHASLDQQLP